MNKYRRILARRGGQTDLRLVQNSRGCRAIRCRRLPRGGIHLGNTAVEVRRVILMVNAVPSFPCIGVTDGRS
jgi:hypothetical protein